MFTVVSYLITSYVLKEHFMIRRNIVSIGLIVFALNFALSNAVQAEVKTVKAMATWQLQGLLTQVGKDKAVLVGALAGVMFMEEGGGKLDASALLCPGTVEVDLVTAKRNGSGRCVITDQQGDQIYATWSCKGGNRGCKGPFQLNGGTGKFLGISGKSTCILRIAMRALGAEVAKDSFQQVAAGLAIWPKFTYNIP